MGGSQRPSDGQLKGAVSITLQDLQWAMSAVKPSAMREVAVDVPKVTPPLTIGFFYVAPTSKDRFRAPLARARFPEMNSSVFPMEEMGSKKELSAVILG